MVLTSHDQLGDTGKKAGFWQDILRTGAGAVLRIKVMPRNPGDKQRF